MLFGIGIDTVQISRVEKAAASERFIKRVFSDAEQNRYKSRGNRPETLAGMWAAKEAVAKAFGTGLGGFPITEIEILHSSSGAPYIELGERARKVFDSAAKTSDYEIFISITHDETTATAICAVELHESKSDAVDAFSVFTDGADVSERIGEIKKALERKRDTNKYDYGKVVILASSPSMPGAPLMSFFSARAALKSGAGLGVIAYPSCMENAYSGRVTEEMLFPLESDGSGLAFNEKELIKLTDKTDAIAAGMGAKISVGYKKTIEWLYRNFGGALVLDAGALTIIKDMPDPTRHAGRLILTPHAGEFDRLYKGVFGGGDELIQKNVSGDKTNLAAKLKKVAAHFDAVVMYKSYFGAAADSLRIVYNRTGSPAAAKGGSGDVLAGVIAALSKRLPPLESAVYAHYILAQCSMRAALALGENSVLPSDIIDLIKI